MIWGDPPPLFLEKHPDGTWECIPGKGTNHLNQTIIFRFDSLIFRGVTDVVSGNDRNTRITEKNYILVAIKVTSQGVLPPTSKTIQRTIEVVVSSNFGDQNSTQNLGLHQFFHGSSSIFPRFPHTLRITRRKNEGVWMFSMAVFFWISKSPVIWDPVILREASYESYRSVWTNGMLLQEEPRNRCPGPIVLTSRKFRQVYPAEN